jgi:hypothetical protein
MNREKFGAVTLIFIVTAAVVMPAVLPGTASSQYQCGCSWINCLSIVRGLDIPSDYRWMGDWDPRFDRDFQTHYFGTNYCSCDFRCGLHTCSSCR